MSRKVKFDNKTNYMKGYKIRIYPTEDQASLIDQRINISVSIYNWVIETEINQYKLYRAGKSDKKFLTDFDVINLYTNFRAENEWCQILPYGSAERAIRNACNAFSLFFKKKNRFPKFKSKKHLRKMSYGVRNDTMYFDNNMLRIEGYPRGEMIFSKWQSGFNYKDKANRIKYYDPVIAKDKFGNYYVSFSLITPKPEEAYDFDNPPENNNPIGIDLNIKDRFVCSNGYRSGSPNIERKIKGLNDSWGKTMKDIVRRLKEARIKSLNYDDIVPSKRAEKRMLRRKKRESKVSNTVKTFIDQQIAKIIKMKPTMIIMEDLSTSDMRKSNKKVGGYISQNFANFNQCIVSMKNKCNQYNIPFVQADPRFPSSQLCSNCGCRKKIFSQKVYKCKNCGLKIDRDLNAAINLKNLAFNI